MARATLKREERLAEWCMEDACVGRSEEMEGENGWGRGRNESWRGREREKLRPLKGEAVGVVVAVEGGKQA